MHHYIKVGLLSLFILNSCNSSEKKDVPAKTEEGKQQVTDSAEPVSPQTWIDIQEKVSAMNEATSYDEIVKMLGKPYDEYATPSLEEEYVLFYNVPGVKGAMFWIMLNTESKKFLYWSGETTEKINVKTH